MRSWIALLGTLFSRVRLAARLVREPAVPVIAKALPFLGLIYVIFPLDFIPDLIPVLGQLDDLGVILIALESFVHLCPPDAVAFHKAAISGGRQYAPMVRDRDSGKIIRDSGKIIDAEFRRDDDKGATR